LSGTAPSTAQSITVQAGATGVRAFGADVNAAGQGVFKADVLVRIDAGAVIGSGTALEYSYSTDGGVNWSSGHTAANTGSPAELLVPGGKLVLSERGTSTSVAENSQFIIHPQTASRDLEISSGEFLQVNNVGSEVFGGYYSGGSEPVFSDSDAAKNIFVTVGKLVAALENNDQQGCAEALDDLQTAQEYFSTQLASVGARENRLDVAGTVLSGLKLNQTERMSNIEDVDLATLLTELANQQLSYEAVLKSSSMIMKMSLVNYL
jgi:flagellar hook-associated protein 3 FlgL